MGFQFLTCPETGGLELIESDETELGTLIVDCSGLHAACAVGCPRTCAAMLDRGDHRLEQREAEGLDEVGDETFPDAVEPASERRWAVP